jgi:Ribose/xylose/arabinose/galactoside ABC-type transport systems, permease components
MIRRYGRELSAALALAALLLAAAISAPSFFQPRNLEQTLVNNAAVLIAAIGTTMVILIGQIDISVGSQFAVAAVVTGLIAQSGVPTALAVLCGALGGAAMGLCNGLLIARLGIPSIVVTLASMVALRDALRWTTQGRWVQDLPASFQWAGFGQPAGEILMLAIAAALLTAFAWALANLRAGRAVYATGSDTEAARLAGISPPRVICWVFVLTGMLTGLAAALNAIRFREVQSSAGVGLGIEDHCRGSGGRRGDHRRPGHVARNLDRRPAPRLHRARPDLRRNQRLLGEGDPGIHHSGGRGGGRHAESGSWWIATIEGCSSCC